VAGPMISKIKGWWQEGEAGAVAVYPARLLLPFAVLTGCVVLGYVTTAPHSLHDLWFFPTYLAAIMIPLLVRRRRAAIFTSDTFLMRPVWGSLLRVPLAGIKSASFYDSGYEMGGFLRLELLVGGTFDLRFNVGRRGEVLKRLQQVADLNLRNATA
jgi:hypothetical protein